jgi:hypothetical protein
LSEEIQRENLWNGKWETGQVQSGQFVVRLSLADELEALTIRTAELVTGESIEFSLQANTQFL